MELVLECGGDCVSRDHEELGAVNGAARTGLLGVALALARIVLAPPPRGWRVRNLSSAVPHPQASLASQAVLRGKQVPASFLQDGKSGTTWGGE